MTTINNLKHYRLLANLTQEQVAEQIGLQCTGRLSRWEAGKAYPSVNNAIKLAKIYNTPVEELYQL